MWSRSNSEPIGRIVENVFCININELEDKLVMCSFEVFAVNILKWGGNVNINFASTWHTGANKKYEKGQSIVLQLKI